MVVARWITFSCKKCTAATGNLVSSSNYWDIHLGIACVANN